MPSANQIFETERLAVRPEWPKRRRVDLFSRPMRHWARRPRSQGVFLLTPRLCLSRLLCLDQVEDFLDTTFHPLVGGKIIPAPGEGFGEAFHIRDLIL
jgi:hypothetical protein